MKNNWTINDINDIDINDILYGIDSEKKCFLYTLNVDFDPVSIEESITETNFSYIRYDLNKIFVDNNGVSIEFHYVTHNKNDITTKIKEEIYEKALELIDEKAKNIENLKKDKLFTNVIRKKKINKIS